jgi:hypothetical protein
MIKKFENYINELDPYGEENWDDDKPIVIGNLMVSPDLGRHTWYEAMEICKNYRGEGFNDWRLPTKDELNKIYKHSKKFGGFEMDWYWSSSKTNSRPIWIQDFANGIQLSVIEVIVIRVRSVRGF